MVIPGRARTGCASMSRIPCGLVHVSRGMDRIAELSRPHKEIFFFWPGSSREKKPALRCRSTRASGASRDVQPSFQWPRF